MDVLIASCSTNENAVRLWRRRRRHGDLGSGSGGGSGGAGSGAELGSGGWTCMAEIKEVSHDKPWVAGGRGAGPASAAHPLGGLPCCSFQRLSL